MALTLSHFSIRTPDLEATRGFYERVLGMAAGPRPDFPFPGCWMYSGEGRDLSDAVVHVIGIDPDDANGLKRYLGDRGPSALRGSGAVDHVAFFATGLAEMRKHLKALGINFRERTVPGLGLHQVFVEDPNGVVVELNYPAAEHAASDC